MPRFHIAGPEAGPEPALDQKLSPGPGQAAPAFVG